MPQLLAGRSPQTAGPGRSWAAGARSAGFVFAALAITFSLPVGLHPPGSSSAVGRAILSPPPAPDPAWGGQAETEIQREGWNMCIYICVCLYRYINIFRNGKQQHGRGL